MTALGPSVMPPEERENQPPEDDQRPEDAEDLAVGLPLLGDDGLPTVWGSWGTLAVVAVTLPRHGEPPSCRQAAC
jgi:hypothetical protein